MRAYAPFFLAFAVLWCLQLYATAKQGQHFMREVSKLRPLGETAIGASSMSRLKRRVYVTLAADETDRVTGAIELSGVTVFARAKPVPELVGTPLTQLAESEDEDRRALACRMAARTLLGLELEDTSGSMSSRRAKPRRGWLSGGGATGARPAHRTAAGATRSVGHLPTSRKSTDVRGD